MCQRLDETESTARGSVESVFVMLHFFKQATSRCRTFFEGQGFRRKAHQLGSSAASEEAPCQPHNDPERGTHFVDQRKFQGKQCLVGKIFALSQLGLTPPDDELSKGAGGVREKIADYLLFVEQRRRTSNYTYIYAADETAVYLDYSSSPTVENKGVREVPVKTSGHDKLHVTVILTARTDGFKCRPYILLKNKRPIKKIVTKFKNTFRLCWASRSFFNDDLTSEFLQKIVSSFMFNKRLLA